MIIKPELDRKKMQTIKLSWKAVLIFNNLFVLK